MSIRKGNTIIAGDPSTNSYTKAEINELLDSKADVNLSNLNNAGMAIGNLNGASNCITNIPQDIKLEISNNTLVLKSGSKLYVPNGFESDGTTPKFNTVITTSNYSLTWSDSTIENLMVTFDPTYNTFGLWIIGLNIDSGSTPPAVQSGNTSYIWYDTTNNLMKISTDTQATWSPGLALPLGQVDSVQGVGFKKINTIFNGFGFIGHHSYVLPGVKGLVPDGRNNDGTVKNKVLSQTKVGLRDFSTEDSQLCFWTGTQLTGWGNTNYSEGNLRPLGTFWRWWNTKDNIMMWSDGNEAWNEVQGIYLGRLIKSSANPISRLSLVNTFSSFNNSSLRLVRVWGSSNLWYRLYSDGFLIQGGLLAGNGSYGRKQLTFPLPYSDTNYIWVADIEWGDMTSWYDTNFTSYSQGVTDITGSHTFKRTTGVQVNSMSMHCWLTMGYSNYF